MKTSEIKTIDVNTKTWFDRTYGNTYFAQRIVLNYSMPDEMEITNPFKYGYSSYEHEAMTRIKKDIPNFNFTNTYDLRQAGIVFRHNKYDNCKQRELKNI